MMDERIGKVFKVFDTETGVIIDEIGINYYYDCTEFLDNFSLKVGDVVKFKVVKKVVSGYSYYQAIYISKEQENKLQITK